MDDEGMTAAVIQAQDLGLWKVALILRSRDTASVINHALEYETDVIVGWLSSFDQRPWAREIARKALRNPVFLRRLSDEQRSALEKLARV